MSHSDRKQNNKFSFWFTCLISDSRQNLLFKIYIKHILVSNNRFFFLSGIMMSQYAKSNKSDMWQIWLLHHVTHRICWLVWQVGLIYKKKQPPNTHFFFSPPQHIPELCRAHPLPKTERSAGDKSSNQLPLLPFNSKNGPMNWILSVLTHILRATIFMLPIQKLPSLNCRVNRTTGTDSPHYILTNCLDISQGECDICNKGLPE